MVKGGGRYFEVGAENIADWLFIVKTVTNIGDFFLWLLIFWLLPDNKVEKKIN